MAYSQQPLTVDWLKAAYLFGQDLTDDDGHPMPDEVWEICLEAAKEWIKTELAIEFPKRTRTQRHDFTRANLEAWSFISLDHRPVRSVVEVKLQYGDFPIFTVPVTWILQEDDGNQLQIIPAGGVPAVAPLEALSFMSYWMATSHRDVPGLYLITYTAGYDLPLADDDPDVEVPPDYSPIPGDILDVIGMRASLHSLNIIGDLVAGRAVANFSVAIQGLSVSKGTTASATNAGLGARIIQYRKQIKESLSRIRMRYQGMQIAVC